MENEKIKNEKIAYSINEAAHALGVSRGILLEMMLTGRLAYGFIGKRRKISKSEIEKLLISK